MNVEYYNEDCLWGMGLIPDGSIDCILTDPPYKYLKNQKLETDFNETVFFNEAKRVLKKDGFIILFGRGSSFYRWNAILSDLGFSFKEEVIWDKTSSTSPLMAMSRVHETVSIHTKGNGTINKIKIPYVEMKEFDIESIIKDIKRLKTVLNNPTSLNAVSEYLQNNSDSSGKTIRSDFYESSEKTKHSVTMSKQVKEARGEVKLINSIHKGMNEKTIIKVNRDHFNTIHPTQKPVRLLERLLELVSRGGGFGSRSVFRFRLHRNCLYKYQQEFYRI